MSDLSIRDGDPWWASPDIRVIDSPTSDTTILHPVAGTEHWVQARVWNRGADDESNALVKFYWANPAVGFTRDTANAIGTAYVSLRAGVDTWVLCLAPWVPSMVNQGHVCLLAEVIPHGGAAPSTAQFTVSHDPRVAQRNVNLVTAQPRKMFFAVPISVMTPFPAITAMTVSARVGTRDDLGRLLPDLREAEDVVEPRQLGLVEATCPSEEQVERAQPKVRLRVQPGQQRMLSVVGRVDDGQVAVVHVEQEFMDRPTHCGGGVTVVVDNREQVETKSSEMEGQS